MIVKDGKELFVPRVGLDFEKCDMELIRCDTNVGTGEASDLGEGELLFYDAWPRNKWGIPEPPILNDGGADGAAKPGDIDLLIVPGLAFDSNGHRLGQGKGYYDRFIARMRQNCSDEEDGGIATEKVVARKPILVGVCLDEQFLEEVPHGVDLGGGSPGEGIVPVSDHDFIMDMVITPSRICSNGSAQH